jgi:hypothetical protein
MKFDIDASGLPKLVMEGQEDINFLTALFNSSSLSISQSFGVSDADKNTIASELMDLSTRRNTLCIFPNDDIAPGCLPQSFGMPTRNKVRQLRLEGYSVGASPDSIGNVGVFCYRYDVDSQGHNVEMFSAAMFPTRALAWQAACEDYLKRGFTFTE